MNINKAYPGDYLNASHIGDARPDVVIENCAIEKFDNGDQKPVLRFQGKERGLVLNKTNANIISAKYGEETDLWSGKPLTLYATKVQFKDKLVDGVRVEVPRGGASIASTPAPTPAPTPEPLSEDFDDVPF